MASAGGVRGAVVEAGEAAGGVTQRRPVARLALLPRALPAAPAAVHDDRYAGRAVWHGAALARVHAVTSDLETTAGIMRHDLCIYSVQAGKENRNSFRDTDEDILCVQNQSVEEMQCCAVILTYHKEHTNFFHDKIKTVDSNSNSDNKYFSFSPFLFYAS